MPTRALLILLALAACNRGSDVDTADTDDTGELDPTQFEPLEEALQADLAASHAYSVSAAVYRNGRVIWAQAYGQLGPDGGTPTPDTLYQIGSTTKQMTAVGLLQRVEDGEAALDDDLETLLPELDFALDPSWDDQITLHHLLTHQGAIYDWIDWSRTDDDDDLADYAYGFTADNLFLMAPPGSFWNYSNPNFIFAGLVTEELDGSRYWSDIMAQDVYQPLGMDRTWLRRSEVAADGDYAESYGYGLSTLATGQLVHVTLDDTPDPGSARPAGLAWSTPTQMLTWADFIMHGDASVLSDALRQEMMEPQVSTLYSDEGFYGYGLMVDEGITVSETEHYPVRVISHGGNTLSFSSELYMIPSSDCALSILSSGYATDFTQSVITGLTTLCPDLPEPDEPTGYSFDPDLIDRHVGHYDDPYNVGEVFVTREGDGLQVEAPFLEQLGYTVAPDLVHLSTDIWYVSVDGTWMDITFIPETEGGDSEWIRNRSFVVTRVDEDTPPPADLPPPSREAVRRWLDEARRHAPAEPPSTVLEQMWRAPHRR